MPSQSREIGNCKSNSRTYQKTWAICIIYIVCVLAALATYGIPKYSTFDMAVLARWYSSIGVVLVALYALVSNLLDNKKGGGWIAVLPSVKGHIGIAILILAFLVTYLSVDMWSKVDRQNTKAIKTKIDSVATSTMGEIKNKTAELSQDVITVAMYVDSMETRANEQHGELSKIVDTVLSKSLAAIKENIKTQTASVVKTHKSLSLLQESIKTMDSTSSKNSEALQSNIKTVATNLQGVTNQLTQIGKLTKQISDSSLQREGESTRVLAELAGVLKQLSDTLKTHTQKKETQPAKTDSVESLPEDDGQGNIDRAVDG